MGRLSSKLAEAKKIARKLKAIAGNEKASEEVVEKFANYYGGKLQELGYNCPWIKKADITTEPTAKEEAKKIALKMKKVVANKKLSPETIERLGKYYGKQLEKLGYGNPLNSMREDTYTATRKLDNKEIGRAHV